MSVFLAVGLIQAFVLYSQFPSLFLPPRHHPDPFLFYSSFAVLFRLREPLRQIRLPSYTLKAKLGH